MERGDEYELVTILQLVLELSFNLPVDAVDQDKNPWTTFQWSAKKRERYLSSNLHGIFTHE